MLCSPSCPHPPVFSAFASYPEGVFKIFPAALYKIIQISSELSLVMRMHSAVPELIVPGAFNHVEIPVPTLFCVKGVHAFLNVPLPYAFLQSLKQKPVAVTGVSETAVFIYQSRYQIISTVPVDSCLHTVCHSDPSN